ncbi:winged helix-turn-helix domain-containing protein [Micromonospora costi]|uniref:winged helix-turn-helix domain-containing protein n=1 Tax=Micromonospora costi TaxID=1530042 RepID=UPI0033EAA22A
MIDYGSGQAVYRQVAATFRARIRAGELKPGDRLPYEGRLSQELGVGKGTIQSAYRLLRNEGLVVTERGYGTYVIEPPPKVKIKVPRGSRIWSRMPTEAERNKLGIEPGAVVPVMEYQVGRQPVQGPFAADRTEFTTA